MIRPEAKEQIMRWREVLAGSAGFFLGLWWLLRGNLLLMLPGAILLAGGAALIWLGFQRARFRGKGHGPGIVQVDEGQIMYFGPLTGGTVALQELKRITLDPNQHPYHWRLEHAGARELLVPVNAEGAETLYDAFATLPGLRMEHALAAMNTSEKRPIVIWQRDVSISARLTLH